jgi:recombination protein RecA
MSDIRADYKHAFTSAQDLADEVKPVINFSPNLDIVLGGGIPLGSFVIVTGQKKLGKTTSVLHFAAKAQQAGCKVYYLNVEGRLKPRDLRGIPGLSLDKDKIEIIKSTKKKILSGDDYLEILMNLIETEENCVFILDSASQLCSSSRHAGTISERFRDDIPLMLATLTKRAANILPVQNNILICITHLIANQGNGPATWMEASGQKIQYAADVKLKVTHVEAFMDGDKQVGQLMHWQCDTSALGPPGGKTTTLLRYGEALDEYYDLLSMLIDIGIVTKSGAWLKFPDGQQCQGKEKARNALKDNPGLYKEMLGKVKEMLG